ncbi:hypothetical protein ACIQAL_22140 [Pseudomonas sp. NPDC088368]|uniref:hypothetical protein n=1 Tax=Pseudomonas sp. NPDC088368 TaxID=3364453 RepID=UPI00381E6D96
MTQLPRAELVQLSTQFIGHGPKLFHVNLSAEEWVTPTTWLVAATDLNAAFDFAIAEYPEIERAEFNDGRDGYQIGFFIRP